VSNPTTPENPWPLRTVARMIADYIHRLGSVWVEGQVTQISARPGTGTAFITLRDPAADLSMTVTCPIDLLREHQPPLTDGTRIVVHARPAYFISRGTLSLRADEIRSVGVGELLARIERLRRLLAAEGLFDPIRKKRLPFLPRTVGLITGRGSAAEHDVLANARARWPAVRFRVEKGELKISASSTETGESEDSIETSYDGDALTIGFNAVYLLDFLRASGNGDVRLELKDPQSAGQLRPGDSEEYKYRYIVMPMRI